MFFVRPSKFQSPEWAYHLENFKSLRNFRVAVESLVPLAGYFLLLSGLLPGFTPTSLRQASLHFRVKGGCKFTLEPGLPSDFSNFRPKLADFAAKFGKCPARGVFNTAAPSFFTETNVLFQSESEQGCQVIPQIFGQNLLILRPNSANNPGQLITKFSAKFGPKIKFTAKNRPEIQSFVTKF